MDVSGHILRTWMPAIHAGMTEICISCPVGERKLMKRFVVKVLFPVGLPLFALSSLPAYPFSNI
jgi:hypothetical protein